MGLLAQLIKSRFLTGPCRPKVNGLLRNTSELRGSSCKIRDVNLDCFCIIKWDRLQSQYRHITPQNKILRPKSGFIRRLSHLSLFGQHPVPKPKLQCNSEHMAIPCWNHYLLVDLGRALYKIREEAVVSRILVVSHSHQVLKRVHLYQV